MTDNLKYGGAAVRGGTTPRGREASPRLGCLAGALLVLSTGGVPAQELFRPPLPREPEIEPRKLDLENLPYTFKSGDFRLLVTPSVEADWVDNVNLSKNDPLQDWIVRPMVQFDASYPLSVRNLLQFKAGIGYDIYLDHSEFDALRLISGSELSLDTYIKDFVINVHDRFAYIQDPAEEAAVASTARYGGLYNTAGVSTTWDQQDLLLGLGYDHQNFVASSSAYDYLNRRSELLSAQAGFRLHPRILTGVEAGGSFTRYDQNFLNDNDGYNAGAFVEWRPGQYFRLQARGGYTALLFDQTSTSLRAMDRDSWYANVRASHQLSEVLSYSLDVGHELRLGTEADSIKAWYARAGLDWSFIKNFKLTSYLSYEHGDQGEPGQGAGVVETYDWLGLNFGLSHPVTKNLGAAIRYRLSLRGSDIALREYAQNLLGIILTYQMK